MSDFAVVVFEKSDINRAERIIHTLRASGIDARGSGAVDHSPSDEYEAALDNAWVVLALWTRQSTDRHGSKAVHRAVEAASQRGAYLGVMLDGVPVPFGFGGLHTVDLGGWDGRDTKRLNTLVGIVKRRFNGSAIAPDGLFSLGETNQRRVLNGKLGAISALIVLLASAVLYQIGLWGSGVQPFRQRLKHDIFEIPCSWLDVDPVDDGSEGTLSLTGVADNPRRVGEILSGLLNSESRRFEITVDRMAQIGSANCPAIDGLRHLRDPDEHRIRVISDGVGLDANTHLAEARISLAFDRSDKTMALFGMESNGTVSMLLPNFEALRGLARADVNYIQSGQRSYEFTLRGGHVGWSGLVLITGSKPLPQFGGRPVAGSELMGMHSGEFSHWLASFAVGGDWQSEMAWYRIESR